MTYKHFFYMMIHNFLYEYDGIYKIIYITYTDLKVEYSFLESYLLYVRTHYREYDEHICSNKRTDDPGIEYY